MKKALLICLLVILALNTRASHIVGGEMTYQYLGVGATPNTGKYNIILKLFRDQNCGTCAAMPTDVFIGIYDLGTGAELTGPGGAPFWDVIKSDESGILINPFPPCISNPPLLDYHVATFSMTVTLPNNANGYSATYQTCCRVHPLENVYNTAQQGATGATYTCTIPPVEDNSPVFTTSVSAICRLKHFTLPFNAVDPDGDSLVYAFEPAFDGGFAQNAGNINPGPLPYNSVSYINGFQPLAPLGDQATIDPKTGIISGIAPDVGRYVVCVGVTSYRGGVVINQHLKDFIVNVTDCDFPGVSLAPQPVSCDGFTVTFANGEAASPQIRTYYWDFGDPASGVFDTSSLQSPTHVYTDTGAFVYKLVINRGLQCSDSATQIRLVYPGFFPGFTTAGTCVNTPIHFTDTTKSRYGVVDAWHWNFGNLSATNDTSSAQDPAYVYPALGTYVAQLTVFNSKGCAKTANDTINIIDKPTFNLTDDTLICSIDTIQLSATGATGTILWTPNYNINSTSSFTPQVSPKTTTIYSATVTEAPACFATKSVVVNVVNKVTLNPGNDSTICQTDSVQLNPSGDGLHYVWMPAALLNNNQLKNPTAAPVTTTTFHVTASIGKCNTSADVTIRVVPYPKANAGNDTAICVGTNAQLHATGGVGYLWSPSLFLNNPRIADPITSAPQSIRYTVAVTDNLGCPKPAFDSVLVEVQNPAADAGPRDTNVVVNQPLQLNGTSHGAEIFKWTPSTGLNDPNISNPVATLSESQQYVLTVQSSAGCTATDTIDITVYKVAPGLYVPNAFTPNGDGINDIFKPILIGMKSFNYFRVYNRDGQLIFSTTQQGVGWDGTFKGKPQDADVFVWIVGGVDYTGKTIFQKGSVTLIR